MTDVLVYGASGYTGSLVTEELVRRGIDVAIAGRDHSRLQRLLTRIDAELPCYVAPIHDDAALSKAMEACRIVINCAGPFSRVGEPIVRAAIEHGVHYLDTSGEQAFLRDMYERYEGVARKASVTVVNGFAFEIALGDWAAAIAARALGPAPLDQISVSYALDRFRPSTGTQLSMLESLEKGGYVWAHDRWEEQPPAFETRPTTFPEPFGVREVFSFPSGEVITVPRHVATHRAQTFISVSRDSTIGRTLAVGATLVGPLLGSLLKTPLGAIAKARLGETHFEPSEDHRRRSGFCIVARAERSFQRSEFSVSGADPYGLTAQILAYGARELLGGRAGRAGVVAPAEAFDADAALSALAEECDLVLVSAT